MNIIPATPNLWIVSAGAYNTSGGVSHDALELRTTSNDLEPLSVHLRSALVVAPIIAWQTDGDTLIPMILANGEVTVHDIDEVERVVLADSANAARIRGLRQFREPWQTQIRDQLLVERNEEDQAEIPPSTTEGEQQC